MAVKKRGAWGYCDQNLKLKVQYQFENAKQFYQLYASVKLNGEWVFIDRKGKKSYPESFIEINVLEGYGYIAKTDTSYKALNFNLEPLNEFYVDEFRDYNEEYLQMLSKESIIYIEKKKLFRR